jgi:hypothetical protein
MVVGKDARTSISQPYPPHHPRSIARVPRLNWDPLRRINMQLRVGEVEDEEENEEEGGDEEAGAGHKGDDLKSAGTSSTKKP